MAFLEYTNFKETDEKEWLDPFFQMGLYFWLHLLLFHHYFSSLIFVIWSADNDNIDNGLGSFSLIKVHIFWEGHKILQNLHVTFVCMYCRRKVEISQNFGSFSEYTNFTKLYTARGL